MKIAAVPASVSGHQGSEGRGDAGSSQFHIFPSGGSLGILKFPRGVLPDYIISRYRVNGALALQQLTVPLKGSFIAFHHFGAHRISSVAILQT